MPIVPTEFAGVSGVDHPVVHFFGGQPGAGKSVAQGSVTTTIIAADGIGAVASIIGDDFRPHHPKFNQLLAERQGPLSVEAGGHWIRRLRRAR